MSSSNYIKNFYINDTIIEKNNTLCPWQSIIIEDLQRQLALERVRNRELVRKIGILEKKTKENRKDEPVIMNIH